MSWIATGTDGVILRVRVVTRASKTELAGIVDDHLKVRLQAPPIEGKANKALAGFLAGKLRVPVRNITILSGRTSRSKRIAVAGLSEHAGRRLLAPEQP